MAGGKMRWADELMEDEQGGLPLGYTSKPDKDGVKTIVEYYYDDKGQPMRRTSRVRVVTVERKVYTVSKERQAWARFGAAARETATDSISMQAQEDIPFERVVATKATTRDKARVDLQEALKGSDKAAVTGNLRDLLYKKRMQRELLRAKGLLGEAEKPPEDDGHPSGSLSASGPKPGSYIPPSVRARMEGGPVASELMQRRNQENSVRVSNLSEEVSEDDLQDLFRPFGPVSRIYLATDRVTGESRGFAFVNYHRREDAERAIKVLDGYGYAHLVLRVDWAQPRAERPFGQ